MPSRKADNVGYDIAATENKATYYLGPYCLIYLSSQLELPLKLDSGDL
jgi:hypothetical protein